MSETSEREAAQFEALLAQAREVEALRNELAAAREEIKDLKEYLAAAASAGYEGREREKPLREAVRRLPRQPMCQCDAPRCERDGCQDKPTPLAEGREGIVTVYDHRMRYLGCMGVETWRAKLREEELREALRRIDDMADRTASTAAFRPDIAAVARAALSEGEG